MTERRFKKGDKVRRIGPVSSGVIGVVFGGIYTVAGYYEGARSCVLKLEEASGLFYENAFESVEAAPPPDPFEGVSDQELADQWRSAMAHSRTLRQELSKRGFKTQWRAPHRSVHQWKDHNTSAQPDELRVYKIVTPAPIETIL